MSHVMRKVTLQIRYYSSHWKKKQIATNYQPVCQDNITCNINNVFYINRQF